MSPRGSQPTLRFCFAATAKQVLLGYKKGREAGQAGSAPPESMPELLQIVTGLRVRANNAICPGIAAQRTPQQRPKPQTGGHGAEPANQRLPESCPAHPGSVTRAAPARHGFSRCPSPWCRAGRQGQPRQPPSPHAGQAFCGCHSALASSRASPDFLLILRQRGGKRAGTSAGGGVVFWENKSSAAACHGPGDAQGWGSSTSLGTALVPAPAAPRGAPGPGTPTQTPAGPTIPCPTPWLWVPVCASLAPSCECGGTGQGATAGGSLG